MPARRIYSYVAGLLLLLCSNAGSALIINASFEAESHGLMPNGVSTSRHDEWGLPDDWAWRLHGNANGHGIRKDYAPFSNQIGWSSEGDWSLYVFASSRGNHTAGQFIEFYQSVDLTDQSTLLFDAMLRGGAYTNSYLAIDFNKLWLENQGGTYLDNVLDISSLSGVHEIQVGVQVFTDFDDSADGWTYFDNLRLVPEPTTFLLLAIALGGLLLTRRKIH